jgi:hypothetical protein
MIAPKALAMPDGYRGDPCRLQKAIQFCLRVFPHGRGAFVENCHRRPPQQKPCYHKPLLLAGRQNRVPIKALAEAEALD